MLSVENNGKRVALTGFMGVGKSSVARHLATLLGCQRVDLDAFIETREKRKIHELIDSGGIDAFRVTESCCLRSVLENESAQIVSLGGGTWTIEKNRELIHDHGITTVWLESSFQHCWQNIRRSRKERPLARDKGAAQKLFDERQKIYALADWHFIIKPEFNSYAIANQIAEEIFG